MRRNEDFLPRPPVPGIHDEITKRPRLVVNDKIFDVANLAVQGLEMVARHLVGASQMAIPCFRTFGEFSPLVTVALNVRIISPHRGTAPIRRPTIITVVVILELPGHGLVTVQGRTVLDLLFGQINRKMLLAFDHAVQRIRGNEHLPAREPVSRVGDQIANGPVPVVEVEFFDLPDLAVEAV